MTTTRRCRMSSMDDMQVGAGTPLEDDFDTSKAKDLYIKRKAEHDLYIGTGFVKHEPILALIEDNFALEALDNFIIVQEDKFRTGYECKACDGEGHGTTVCPKCKGSKTRVISDICPERLGKKKVLDLFRALGEPEGLIKYKTCKECEGT